ncbi:amidase [Galactobacter caseinivorans]|uniref:Amidase n=1 Tax=Galactobacter caseinivorans TaxID=2676123 RepID=A0A496PIJ5_9MICC|nr:amidase [Galactobacter caseinivorans]RKW70305.1 amidase [Galactobacter caseinivorans]
MTTHTTAQGPARHVDGGLPSAVQLRRLLLNGSLTARALTERCLARITELDPELHAFVTLDREAALAAADAADAVLASARESGAEVPALTGLPTAFKDLVDVAGFPTSFGTAAFPPLLAARDAPLVARLRASGVVLLGKTAVPEFGLSSHSENLIHPPARNPLDPGTSPGGSSGGAAAAVAAGMLPLAPGNDGGGSVRIPAAACGLVGLKPGLGALPEDVLGADGTPVLTDRWGAPRLAVSGPLGRDAADAALLYDGLRCDPARPSATPALDVVQAALEAGDAWRGLRVGVTARSAFEASLHPVLEPEAAAAFERGQGLIAGLGGALEEAEWEVPADYAEAFRAVWTAGLAEAAVPDAAVARMGALARDFRREATARGGDAQRAAAVRLTEIAAGLRRDWGRYDVVLTPAMAQTPRPIGFYTSQDPETDYELQCRYTPYTSSVNVSGLPAIVVPTFWTPSGFSMGVQLIGRAGSEEQLLALAALVGRAAQQNA